MTEQAFLADALTAIRAQQTVIERCSSNIARAMQENADAFRELRSSISTLNEMVSSVQAIARVALPGPSGTRGMVPVVEIPTRGRKIRKGSEAGMTPEPRSRRGVQPGSGLGSGSSRDAVSTAVRARRSETPIVQARKKRKLVDLGLYVDYATLPTALDRSPHCAPIQEDGPRHKLTVHQRTPTVPPCVLCGPRPRV